MCSDFIIPEMIKLHSRIFVTENAAETHPIIKENFFLFVDDLCNSSYFDYDDFRKNIVLKGLFCGPRSFRLYMDFDKYLTKHFKCDM
ncbi:hypothetical protein [Sigmofec virus UA08Rod_4769]|uniref:Uncharacterized protein n=1 Tax=Sigmofec virus UA08Rod_4769 TaxID=2929408 RepID=A0A976N1P4_9VIRU|nr:hypothetical protein [Sigmofec virus UA08Rod_4769]